MYIPTLSYITLLANSFDKMPIGVLQLPLRRLYIWYRFYTPVWITAAIWYGDARPSMDTYYTEFVKSSLFII